MKLFSERYNYQKVSDVIIREKITPEIQNAICSCYDKLPALFNKYSDFYYETSYVDLEKHLWTHFFNQREGKFQDGSGYCVVSTPFLENDRNTWYRKLDLIEFTIKYLYSYGNNNTKYLRVADDFVRQLNAEFERLNFAYRVVDTEIVEITSTEEIASINASMHDSPQNIKTHLSKALELYAQRPIGDYRNSIKESISAVEAYCREITGENTFGDALNKLSGKGLVIPKILKAAFVKLYAYTNQSNTGIRHALMDEEGTYTPGPEEALFMLVSCSAFINYLNNKLK